MAEKAVTAPFDGAFIQNVPAADANTVEKALATAYGLYRDRSSWIPKHKRIDILRKTAEIIKERREDLALQAAREGGKPLPDSLVEIDRAADGVENCIEVIRAEGGKKAKAFDRFVATDKPDLTGGIRFVGSARHATYVEIAAYRKHMKKVRRKFGWDDLEDGCFESLRRDTPVKEAA